MPGPKNPEREPKKEQKNLDEWLTEEKKGNKKQEEGDDREPKPWDWGKKKKNKYEW
jgi:hypothetical protein